MNIIHSTIPATLIGTPVPRFIHSIIQSGPLSGRNAVHTNTEIRSRNLSSCSDQASERGKWHLSDSGVYVACLLVIDGLD